MSDSETELQELDTVLSVPRLSKNLDQIVCFQLCRSLSIAQLLQSSLKIIPRVSYTLRKVLVSDSEPE